MLAVAASNLNDRASNASALLWMLAFLCGVFNVDRALSADEVHIVTRDGIGDFMGSHKLYTDLRPGLTQVTYCGRSYFAYPKTVRWSERLGAEGYNVGLELSDGSAWELICQNPQDQVRHADLDLTKLAEMKTRRKRTKGGAWVDIVAKRRLRNTYHSK